MFSRRRLFLLAAAAGLLGCRPRRRSPEDEVRDTLAALETAVEEKELSALRDLISERFTADELADRPAALALLRAVLARHPRIHLLVRIVTIDLEPPPGAKATLVVAAAALPINEIPDVARVSAEILSFDLALAKESPSRWRVLTAAWRPGQPQDFLSDP